MGNSFFYPSTYEMAFLDTSPNNINAWGTMCVFLEKLSKIAIFVLLTKFENQNYFLNFGYTKVHLNTIEMLKKF